MRLGVMILRIFHRAAEDERMEWRNDLARARATANDLTRTMSKMDPEVLRQAAESYSNGRLP